MDPAPWEVTNVETGGVVDRAPTYESAMETVEEYADVALLEVAYSPRA